MSVTFSKNLVEQYQAEMVHTYGVAISYDVAQAQLYSLTRCLFPTDIAEQRPESIEVAQGKVAATLPACASSLSGMLGDGGGNEVGASITPTSRHRDT